jgi:hypothetical protein
VTELVEFKAFDLFSLSLGIGMVVQSERAGTPLLVAAPGEAALREHVANATRVYSQGSFGLA